MTAMVYDFLATPIGRLLLAGDAAGLRCIAFEDARQAGCIGAGWRHDAGALRSAREQLAAWFAGELTVFDIALAPQGTPFQRAVWAQLQRLPYAGTISYGELAQRLGRPAARRAVGAANGANPLPIVVPCHRVIGADGQLTGFGGGLALKRWLLQHERRHAAPPFALAP
ncbi:MAG TPA: methylated-DNA--[protein]-cysteine S-methyltransferase [Rhodanobacteraceae bacterium]|nr:methylated-DNA--[protein]-cysteine S-methyltransferase [Rhodanobacteraceae bacterium]